MIHTILLVDDSRTMREVLKVYLMGRKFDFVEADGAERALQLLRLLPVSLVIVDLKMPKMDGVDFLLQMRASELPLLRRIPRPDRTPDRSRPGRRGGRDAAFRRPRRADLDSRPRDQRGSRRVPRRTFPG